MKTRYPWATATLLTLGLILSGCSLSLLNGGTARTSIGISMKQPAAPITSAVLVVTGPGMNPITRTISMTAADTALEVPAGEDRIFRVLVNTVSVTFLGETSVDLAAGDETVVTVQPKLSSTQIIIPDFYNNRVVQIADMSGTGWRTRTWSQLGFGNNFEFQPVDIDFDAEGRIYVANDNSSAGIVRFPDINAGSHEVITTGIPANALAIDRSNDILYFTHRYQNDIYRVDLNGPGPPYTEAALNITGEAAVSFVRSLGLAVDSQGFLYVANTNEQNIFKYDPNGVTPNKVVGTYSGNIGSPYEGFDVMVKEPYVYVANTDAPNGYAIQKLDKNMGFIDAFGSVLPGEFLGPRRFLAILNKRIYLIDEEFSDDRLVSFDSSSFGGWATYGSQGTGVGEFDFPFYGFC
jgi:hypothetical protein